MLSLTPTSVQCIHHKPSKFVSACTKGCICKLQYKRTKEGVDKTRECMRQWERERLRVKRAQKERNVEATFIKWIQWSIVTFKL